MTLPYIGRLTFWKSVAIVLFILAFYVAGVRFFGGLGEATNLNDAFPWGIWIGFDLLVGVGLAAGGFVIAATVHIFGLHKYEAIARPAILTAFLGYLLVIVALLFDLGLPWRIWHPLVYWNHHSVMFEVGWCVMLYTTVLAAEFSPMIFEKLGWYVPLKIVKAIYIPLVIAGVLLSTMHQSSLGTLYVIAPDKLHGLWYSPLLPILFFISAIAAGLAMTIFESYLSHRAFGKSLESSQLRGLAKAAVVVLGIYAVMRLFEMASVGSFMQIFQLTQESVLFWGEFGLGVIVPMVLFSMRRVRNNRHGLFFAAVLTVTGFVINRMNVAITGFLGTSEVNYFPSWMEVTVTAALVAAGFVLFSLAVKYLNIFPEEGDMSAESVELRRAKYGMAWSGRAIIGLWMFMIAGVILVGITSSPVKATPPKDIKTLTAVSSVDVEVPDDVAFPMAEESPGEVTFSHFTHVYSLDQPDCAQCHQSTWRMDATAAPVEGTLTYERIHEGELCYSCHNGEAAFGVEDNCMMCHQ
jgi:c(7)-type cytochrome triheme protein